MPLLLCRGLQAARRVRRCAPPPLSRCRRRPTAKPQEHRATQVPPPVVPSRCRAPPTTPLPLRCGLHATRRVRRSTQPTLPRCRAQAASAVPNAASRSEAADAVRAGVSLRLRAARRVRRRAPLSPPHRRVLLRRGLSRRHAPRTAAPLSDSGGGAPPCNRLHVARRVRRRAPLRAPPCHQLRAARQVRLRAPTRLHAARRVRRCTPPPPPRSGRSGAP